MNVKMSLEAQNFERLDEDAYAILARDLNIDLNDSFEAKFQPQEGVSGGKGVVELGSIILTLVGAGGVAVNLINVLNSYFTRAPKLELELENENGRKIRLSSVDVEPDKIEQTIRILDKYLKDE